MCSRGAGGLALRLLLLAPGRRPAESDDERAFCDVGAWRLCWLEEEEDVAVYGVDRFWNASDAPFKATLAASSGDPAAWEPTAGFITRQ